MPLRTCGRRLSALLLLVFASASSASAQVTYTVNSVLDQIDDDTSDGICHTAANTCTLRAAVMQANLASGAGATIQLAATTYTLVRPASGPNGPDNGDLNFTSPSVGNPTITLVGTGEATTIIDANQIDRVLTVSQSRTATLSHLTLRNGFLSGSIEKGGGIVNSGTLTLDHCTVSDNEIDSLGGFGGGGIHHAAGVLHLVDSSVRGNRVTNSGGGISSQAPVYLTRSTIDGNTAIEGGGGVVSVNSSLTITDSTISRNTSHFFGGGIISIGSSTLIVTNSTIVLNNADDDAGGISATNANIYSSTIAFNGADADHDASGGRGGGIYVDGAGPFNIANTMIVGNTLFDAPIYDDCYGTVTSYRRNLLWDVEAGCTINFGGGDGAFGLNSLDLLGALQKNGGPTETIALLPGSNAIDFGDTTLGCTGPDGLTLTNDQRGAARSRGIRCDVGAYESGTLFFDGFESGNLGAWSSSAALLLAPTLQEEVR